MEEDNAAKLVGWDARAIPRLVTDLPECLTIYAVLLSSMLAPIPAALYSHIATQNPAFVRKAA